MASRLARPKRPQIRLAPASQMVLPITVSPNGSKKEIYAMKSNILKIILLSVVAAAMAFGPATTFAQDAPEKKQGEAAVEKQDAAKKKGKSGNLPARGKLVSVDKTAKTITVGKRIFHVTAETKLEKAGKPATLDDAVAGEAVGISYKNEGGKLMALTLRFGPPPEGKAKGEKKEKKQKQE